MRRAQLVKVTCGNSHDFSVQGLPSVFEFDGERPNQPSQHCSVVFRRSPFLIEIERTTGHKDPNPLSLLCLEFLSDEYLLGIRIYKSMRSIELRLEPKSQIVTLSMKAVWDLKFRTESNV